MIRALFSRFIGKPVTPSQAGAALSARSREAQKAFERETTLVLRRYCKKEGRL